MSREASVRTGLALLLAAAVIAVYAPSLGTSFQFDDYNVILRDSRVQSLAAWWQSMPGMRAVLKLSFALNREAGGGVRAFRAVNIGLHALNAVLVLALLLRLSRRCGHDERAALFCAFAAALLFALHPAQTEAVTYISGRSTSLVATFCLVALLAWLRALDGGASSTRWAWIAALGAALGLATKETAAALPVVLLLCAWIAAPRDAADPERRRTWRAAAWRASWPLAGVFVVAAVALALLPAYRDLVVSSLALRDSLANLLTQTVALPWLVGQLTGLAPLNADPDLRPVSALTTDVVLRAAAILAVLAAAIALRRRAPALTFAVLWFFAWLLPTHTLLPREDLANDRQLYLAMIGPVWAAALYGWMLFGRGVAAMRRRLRVPANDEDGAGVQVERVCIAFGAVIVTVLGVALGHATLTRNRVYATEVTYWEDVVRHSPQKARSWNNLGHAYALACRDAAADTAFARAMTLDPADNRPRINRLLLSRGMIHGSSDAHCSRSRGTRDGMMSGDD